MSSTLSPEQRFDLITRGLEEVNGGDSIKAILAEGKNPKGIWVTAPTGKPHIGYLVPMAKMADFLHAGVEVTICLADIYAFAVNYKQSLETVSHRTKYYKLCLSAAFESIGIPTTNLRFVEESSYQLTREHAIETYKLCALASQRDVRATGEELANTAMLSPLLCPILQALDEEYLGSDFDFGGLDQRGLFAFAEQFLPKLGYKKRAHMMNPMLPGLISTGTKMSASIPDSKIDCLDSPETVFRKISKVCCGAGEVAENPILALLKIALIPISRIWLERMQDKSSETPGGDQRPFSSVDAPEGALFSSADAPEGTLFSIELDAKDGGGFKHYKSYDEIERDSSEGELHPEALKKAVAGAVNRLLAPLQKSYAESDEWQAVEKLAYPEPEGEEIVPTATMPYDLNFCFPVRELSNERVKLTPFDPSIHASAFFKAALPHPEVYAHMALGPFTSVEQFVNEFIKGTVHPDTGMTLYAVIDKTRAGCKEDEEGALAGVMSYLNTSKPNLSTEIGYIIILPAFQRTHVTSNGVGLLLQYALEPESNGGLGLRRVQWQTSSANTISIRSAERLGFIKEGVLRWDRVFYGGKTKGKAGNGREMPSRGNEDDVGRDTVVFSICWDDWEQGGMREKMQAIMDRRSA